MCDYQSIHDLYNTGDVCQPLKCKSTTMSNGKRIGNFLLSSDEMSDAQSASSSSLYSTNYTMSNLVGPGRVLGNLYSSLGRRLERSIGASAHKAGFEPSTAYKKIQDCCETAWSDGHLVERKLSHLLQNSYYIHYRLS